MDDQEQHNRYNELAQKLLDGTISETEMREYLDWLNREEEPLYIPADFAKDRQELKHRMYDELHSVIENDTDRSTIQRKWYRYAAAAVIFLMVAGAATYFLLNRQQKPTTVAVVNKPVVNDVLPGGNGAILTLANGQRLQLDSLGNGIIATQGKTNIKIQNGQLVYDALKAEGELMYNTMTTPKGRQFQLLLPDGSKVWLNAASSITYPAAFTGRERIVKVSGEAYFEVARNERQPFVVHIGDKANVQVLGTSFNINSYEDEPGIRTTLLDGKIKVVNREPSVVNGSAIGSRQSAILEPGEQALLAHDSRLTIDVAADTSAAMAWKNGRFEFNGNTIQSIMRQLSRWYDVEVVYKGDLPEANFVGAIERKEKLSQVLKMLELTNVIKFEIQEKTGDGETARIVVMRK